MKTVKLEHEYAAPAEDVWALATDLDALREIMDGVVAFEGFPSGRVYQGQKINVQVSLFGKLPPQPYFMEVLECDNEAMILRSLEKGAGVKAWRHSLTVEPLQSRVSDLLCMSDPVHASSKGSMHDDFQGTAGRTAEGRGAP